MRARVFGAATGRSVLFMRSSNTAMNSSSVERRARRTRAGSPVGASREPSNRSSRAPVSLHISSSGWKKRRFHSARISHGSATASYQSRRSFLRGSRRTTRAASSVRRATLTVLLADDTRAQSSSSETGSADTNKTPKRRPASGFTP